MHKYIHTHTHTVSSCHLHPEQKRFIYLVIYDENTRIVYSRYATRRRLSLDALKMSLDFVRRVGCFFCYSFFFMAIAGMVLRAFFMRAVAWLPMFLSP